MHTKKNKEGKENPAEAQRVSAEQTSSIQFSLT